MELKGWIFLVGVVCYFVGLVIGAYITDKKHREKEFSNLVGTIHVNTLKPDEDFLHLTLDESFVHSICGPDASPVVKFAIKYDD